MTDDPPESAVRQVANLRAGETYCKAKFIPAIGVSPDRIRRAKVDLMRTLSPVVARAKLLSYADYAIHGIHSHTAQYDVVVAAIVVRTDA